MISQSSESFHVFKENAPHPVVSIPKQKILFRIVRFLALYGIFQIFLPVFILSSLFRRRIDIKDVKEIYDTVNKAHDSPITKNQHYQSPQLLARLWKLPSARIYVSSGALEYQSREGYCGRTTLRCVLKSFSVPDYALPDRNIGTDSTPEKWCASMHKATKSIDSLSLKTQIVGGDVSYSDFVTIIRKTLSNQSCRMAVNYLRGPLFGFQRPKWIPIHTMIGILGGHFSPIVGILERDDETKRDDPLVAIFDVNASYGGTYLVPATVLYESVRAMDFFSKQRRALIVTERIKETK